MKRNLKVFQRGASELDQMQTTKIRSLDFASKNGIYHVSRFQIPGLCKSPLQSYKIKNYPKNNKPGFSYIETEVDLYGIWNILSCKKVWQTWTKKKLTQRKAMIKLQKK